ncbi:hypothetical protein A7J50_1809 [Pseudomonas antarctica]|jgi:uncharacterized integral membrane protein|uniref:Lipopolysaccharide assembly protein A domain-containing protein n=1 Tax=Pseudomonas antarctica TaxID=219572 RepID=A0A172YYH2_9PSED|nr:MULTISPECIES: lipopolysaccharide assembly protein LapA domain-containing protein [Pseudomonas]ANF85231.1 hypothetical protein A7J50_1809 [Pseudomonas antarctica]UXV21470.1 alkaline shock response membrane anchor protein AmaP [Pseudomonas fluorescens]
MRGVKRAVLVLVALIIALVVLGFVLENQQSVSLSFFGWATAQMPVAVFVVAALIIGMLMGPLLGVGIARSRRQKTSTGGRI